MERATTGTRGWGGPASKEHQRRPNRHSHRPQDKLKPLKMHKHIPEPKARHQALILRSQTHTTPQKASEKTHNEEPEERAGEPPPRAITATTVTGSAKGKRDPPLPHSKTPTPLLERPRRLVVVPGVHHLPPDLDPLEVDLGFRRATFPQKLKHIDDKDGSK
ncbi:hypothetical protein Bca4012_080633 [Brassica carinata]